MVSRFRFFFWRKLSWMTSIRRTSKVNRLKLLKFLAFMSLLGSHFFFNRRSETFIIDFKWGFNNLRLFILVTLNWHANWCSSYLMWIFIIFFRWTSQRNQLLKHRCCYIDGFGSLWEMVCFGRTHWWKVLIWLILVFCCHFRMPLGMISEMIVKLLILLLIS